MNKNKYLDDLVNRCIINLNDSQDELLTLTTPKNALRN